MPEIIVSPQLVDYREAVAFMETRVAQIIAGTASECLWFLEHPPLYSAGTSAQTKDLLNPDRFPIYASQRGGGYTYHGPGQRVVYVMLDLRQRGRDVRHFVQQLENWIIKTLADFSIAAHISPTGIGVWVTRPDTGNTGHKKEKEEKIAAIGLRLRHWVSFHGIAINVAPALDHFDGIVPCGISHHNVTSLAALGKPTSMPDLDKALLKNFSQFFVPQ